MSLVVSRVVAPRELAHIPRGSKWPYCCSSPPTPRSVGCIQHPPTIARLDHLDTILRDDGVLPQVPSPHEMRRMPRLEVRLPRRLRPIPLNLDRNKSARKTPCMNLLEHGKGSHPFPTRIPSVSDGNSLSIIGLDSVHARRRLHGATEQSSHALCNRRRNAVVSHDRVAKERALLEDAKHV